MKASELRIGNLVGSIGIEYLVWKIDGLGNIQGIDNGTTFNLDKTTYPIKITEEFLKQFGFNQLNGSYWERNGVGFIVGYAVDGSMVVGNSFGARHCHYYYVHQLQNLYFALTGEELTLNQEL
jgi:hypothetical protein